LKSLFYEKIFDA
jgi:hypothetical protein